MKSKSKKRSVMIMVIVALTGSIFAMNVNALSYDYKAVSNNVYLNGSVSCSSYNPAGGVYGYAASANTYLTGSYTTSSAWHLISTVHLDNYNTGALIDSETETGQDFENNVTASVGHSGYLGVTAKAFGAHEVRGAYSGGVYTSSGTVYI
jgi:hypothetical protein